MAGNTLLSCFSPLARLPTLAAIYICSVDRRSLVDTPKTSADVISGITLFIDGHAQPVSSDCGSQSKTAAERAIRVSIVHVRDWFAFITDRDADKAASKFSIEYNGLSFTSISLFYSN